MDTGKEKKSILFQGGDDVFAIIVDLGLDSVKAGYAQEDTPRICYPSYIGYPTNDPFYLKPSAVKFPLHIVDPLPGIEVKNCLQRTNQTYHLDPTVFESLISCICKGYYSDSPVVHGTQSQRFVCDSKSRNLCADLSERPVLLTEPSIHVPAVRNTMAEILFEKFKSPALYVVKSAITSAFAVGKQTGIVVELGGNTTSVTGITEGFTLRKSATNYPIGGSTLDLLSYIKLNPTHSDNWYWLKGVNTNIKCEASFTKLVKYNAIRVIREAVCQIKPDEDPETIKNIPIRPSALQYAELPDRTRIDPDLIRWSVGETLFDPTALESEGIETEHFPGLPNVISSLAHSADVDLRRDLQNNIILTGGLSMMKGLHERLSYCFQKDESLLGVTLKHRILPMTAFPDRRFASWLGASILASLGTFQQSWISASDYEEYGTSCLERLCH